MQTKVLSRCVSFIGGFDSLRLTVDICCW